MECSRRQGRWFDWLWFLAFGLASSLWCVTAAGTIGATFDEPGDLANGLDYWHTGSHQKLLRLGAMPLPMDVAALPVYLYERWTGTPADFEAPDQPWTLYWARLALLGFWWLLLLYARLTGRQLAGPWGGRLAVALLAC